MGMKVEKLAWDDASVMIKRVARNYTRNAMMKHVLEFVTEVKNRVEQSILSQSFKISPLTKKYLKWKIAKGYSTRVLIRTGRYVKSIVIKRIDDPKTKEGLGYAVGIDGRKKTASGEPMWKLAAWLEYGTKRMPARPHWRPVTAWAGEAWPRHMKKRTDEHVRGSR